MHGLKSFGSEMTAIVKSKKTLISVIGILFIPIMYSGMLIGAFWDPYGQLSKLPVAVVNEDAGAELEGNSIAIGDDLIGRLKDNDEFRWDFVSREKAEAGLKDGGYYLAIEIPEDFSEKAATLMDEEPKPASLVYVKNEGANYLAGKIGDSAVEKLKSDVSAEVTKAYTETVFESIGEAADGFAEASDGAAELADGAEKAKDGAELLRSNLAKLSDGTLQLQSGVRELESGTAQLASGADGVADGAEALADGLAQLDGAAAQLRSAAAEAAEAGGQLAAGLDSAQQGEARLADNAAALAGALAQLAAAGPAGGAGDAAAESGDAAAEDAAGGSPAAEQQAAAAERLQQLADAARAVAAGADELAAGGAKLAAGADSLQQGQAGLQQGLDAFGAQLERAADSGAKLAAGAEDLAAGAARVNHGAAAAEKGAADLADGSGRLESGSAELASGAQRLADGSSELSGKLGDASRDADVNGTDKLYDMFAQPVEVSEQKLTEVPNYGTGFAPYFLSLGLFVGALLSTVVLPLRKPSLPPRSGWSWYAGKTGMVTVVALAQALIADLILLYGIGLEVLDVRLFVALSIAASFTFMIIVQFLVTTMDNPGRFIGVILLILQLTGSAGTYPKELVPDWLQKIGDWLPMTYSIKGFRDIISGGDLADARGQLLYVLAFAVPFTLLMLAYFLVMNRRNGRAAADDAALPDPS